MTDPTRTDAVILPSLETPTLTKAELAELLFDRIGLNKRESKDIVEAFFDLLHEALVQCELAQTALAQSSPIAQAPPSWQAGQVPPPQSMSVSVPLSSPSSQVKVRSRQSGAA